MLEIAKSDVTWGRLQGHIQDVCNGLHIVVKVRADQLTGLVHLQQTA